MSVFAENKSPEKTGLTGRLHQWFKDEHAVGLDIGGGVVAAAHFARQKDGLVVDALAAEKTPPNLSIKEQAQCLHAFWRKHKLPTRTVCTSLHSPSLIVRSFSYTNVLENELKNVLPLEAEEALQLPQDDISFSWQLNPLSDRKNEISGTLIAAPRSIVRDHIRMIKAAGLYPVNVEIACSAVINLYAFARPEVTAPVCLVNLNSRLADIVIVSGKTVLPRVVLSSNPDGWNRGLDHLSDSIQSTLLHYQLKLKGAPIARLLLSGGERPAELAAQLSACTEVPVETWNPFASGKIRLEKHLQQSAAAGGDDRSHLAVCLGLGLRHPKHKIVE